MSLKEQFGKDDLITGWGHNRFGKLTDDRIPSDRAPSVESHSHGLPVRRWQPHPITQWACLWREEFVELREGHKVTDTGWVDEVTEDGTILWIYLSGGMGRKMLHSNDGLDIWRVESRIFQDGPHSLLTSTRLLPTPPRR